MIWYWMGLALVLHVYLWGLGLTWLILPGRWRRFWPAFCAPVGLGLQSAVVWVGTHTSLPGTDHYARASLVLPMGLFVAATAVHRPAGTWRLLVQLRRWWAVAAIMVGSLTLQTYPFTRPPHVLTAIAMTSCDAADYAAGARVFEEFSRADHTGYLGVKEPVRQLAVDNFYDFWLRINHFSPSALVALDASLLKLPPYQMVTLMGVVLLTLHLPGVFWLARSAFRFGELGSLAVTALYAVSPALFYAMYQVALGQLLAAPAVALLTWAGIQSSRTPGTWRRYAGYAGLLLVGNWLLLGSYNFFLLFAYVPVVGYVGLRTLIWGRWMRAVKWSAFVVAALIVGSFFAPERIISLAQRFFLFNKTPFGWPIPGFYPSGWYGGFADIYLHPATAWWVSVLTGLCLAYLTVALLRVGSRDARAVVLAAACTLPILFGYWLLLHEDSRLHDNASYDAYKLFTVFYPGILISMCLWMRAATGAGPTVRIGTASLWVALLAVSLSGDARFNNYIRYVSFRVDPPLSAVGRLETLPDMGSVNVYLGRYWDRLWSNYFLLRKPQFFTLPTYEGRPVTAPFGQWDLDDRVKLLSVHYAGSDDPLGSNPNFTLADSRDSGFLRVDFGSGWYQAETIGTDHWRWSGVVPEIKIDNPHPESREALLSVSLRSVAGRTGRLCVGTRCLWEGPVGIKTSTVRNVPISLAPGTTVLRLETPEPADHVPGDARPLTFALYGLDIDVPTQSRATP